MFETPFADAPEVIAALREEVAQKDKVIAALREENARLAEKVKLQERVNQDYVPYPEHDYDR